MEYFTLSKDDTVPETEIKLFQYGQEVGSCTGINYSITRSLGPEYIMRTKESAITFGRKKKGYAGNLILEKLDGYEVGKFNIVIRSDNKVCVMIGCEFIDEGKDITLDNLILEEAHTFFARDIVPWIK